MSSRTLIVVLEVAAVIALLAWCGSRVPKQPRREQSDSARSEETVQPKEAARRKFCASIDRKSLDFLIYKQEGTSIYVTGFWSTTPFDARRAYRAYFKDCLDATKVRDYRTAEEIEN